MTGQVASITMPTSAAINTASMAVNRIPVSFSAALHMLLFL